MRAIVEIYYCWFLAIIELYHCAVLATVEPIPPESKITDVEEPFWCFSSREDDSHGEDV